MPAYDGRKSMYTAGALPFTSKEFVIKLAEDKGSSKWEKEYKVTIKHVGQADLNRSKHFLRGRQMDAPHETIQVLDIVLRTSPSDKYITVSRSFFSPAFGTQEIGDGFECWRGYYQSLRPTQMGLSLNIDISATSFFKAIPVVEFIAEHLNLREVRGPMHERDRIKVKKMLRGLRVQTTHSEDAIRQYKVTGITQLPLSQLKFPVGDQGIQITVIQYFKERYNYSLKLLSWPCLQVGSESKPTYLPIEVCSIIEGQRYTKKLTDRQVTAILRATCKRPPEREQSIEKMVTCNNYSVDKFSTEFGVKVSEKLATLEARVLPPPMVFKHEWPAKWQSFIPDLVSAAKSSETICENCMVILKLLSEEVFDFSRGEMTQLKIKELKQSFNSEFQLIHELCLYVLSASQRTELIRATLNILPPGTNIPDAYANGSGEEQAFVQNLALFFNSFYKAFIHGVVDGLGSALFQRRQLYSSTMSKLRMLMICLMAKPEDVLIVEDENGNNFRETMKDNAVLVQYKTMRETLIYLSHLDNEDTEQQMLRKLSKQLSGEDWSWNNLNTLCWAIGSISGSMVEEQEKRFLVMVIRYLLNLCEITKGKDNKAVIASNIMYVVGQYPRFLRAHWKFLKTVVNKLFEFMHETHPGVQDMACDTFLKIVQKCKRKFVITQEILQLQCLEEAECSSEFNSRTGTVIFAVAYDDTIHAFVDSRRTRETQIHIEGTDDACKVEFVCNRALILCSGDYPASRDAIRRIRHLIHAADPWCSGLRRHLQSTLEEFRISENPRRPEDLSIGLIIIIATKNWHKPIFHVDIRWNRVAVHCPEWEFYHGLGPVIIASDGSGAELATDYIDDLVIMEGRVALTNFEMTGHEAVFAAADDDIFCGGFSKAYSLRRSRSSRGDVFSWSEHGTRQLFTRYRNHGFVDELGMFVDIWNQNVPPYPPAPGRYFF